MSVSAPVPTPALFDLAGRVAIVTGGNGGIGFAFAQGLVEAGAAVAITGRNAAKGADAEARLGAGGGTAVFIEADIGDEASCVRMAAGVADRLGGIDILVNNAGIHVPKPALDMPVDAWDAELRTNLTGTFLASRAVYPHLVARGGGKIINVGSVAALHGQLWAADYAASKGGIVSLTRALAVEWAAQNIQVNAVIPGLIRTDMTGPGQRASAEFEAMVERRTLAGRWGVPDDFRGVGVFLASAASAFVTGTTLVVDGGYSVPLF